MVLGAGRLRPVHTSGLCAVLGPAPPLPSVLSVLPTAAMSDFCEDGPSSSPALWPSDCRQ